MVKLVGKPPRQESSSQLRFDFEQLPPVETSALDNAQARFAERFAALLDADRSACFDNPAVRRLAQEIFGSAAGHARDIYDAAETGFNLYLQRVGLDLAHPSAAIDRLLAEQARLPTQTTRDQNQVDFQQFSTPPAQAAGGGQGSGPLRRDDSA